MRLTIAYSKIKKRNLVLINNVTHQRETLAEWPIRLPFTFARIRNLGCKDQCLRAVSGAGFPIGPPYTLQSAI